MYDVGVAHRTDCKLLVTHVQDLGHVDRGRGVAVVEVVQEELEVANDNELAYPAFLDTTHLGYFDVALVSSTNTTRWINAQWSLC